MKLSHDLTITTCKYILTYLYALYEQTPCRYHTLYYIQGATLWQLLRPLRYVLALYVYIALFGDLTCFFGHLSHFRRTFLLFVQSRIGEYIRTWRDIESDAKCIGKTLIDRMTTIGIVYTNPLDHRVDKIELERSLTWGHFDGLFFFVIIPGEELYLCIVSKTVSGGNKFLHYRYTTISPEQHRFLEKSESLLVAIHILIRTQYHLSAFPHIREEMIQGVKSTLAFVVVQQCKPAATIPSFSYQFSIEPKIPTIFGYPGDQYNQADQRLWGRVRVISHSGVHPSGFGSGFGVVFGLLGEKESLDIHSIVLQEGVVACSRGKQPWQVRSYLYGKSSEDSKDQIFEYEIIPVYKQANGVLVLAYINTLEGEDIVLSIESGTSNFEGGVFDYKKTRVEIPPRSLRMFSAIETSERGTFVFRHRSSASLNIDKSK